LTPYLDRMTNIAVKFSNHNAIEEDTENFSYGAFYSMARQYAHAINSAKTEARVLIHLPPGIHAYAAMFGAGLAGAVYAPVNISQPVSKRQAIKNVFVPHIVIGDDSVANELGLEKAIILDPSKLPKAELECSAKPHELAYVIFTSGSTGTPKGVTISRTALNHFIDWIEAAINPTHLDRWSQHPNIGFDLSVMDIYGALCFGSTLVPLQSKLDRLMPGQAVKKHGLTIWNSVPSVLDLMVRADQLTAETFSTVRLATFCGEPLRQEHLMALFQARPDLLVYNTYGPTEATVSCTLRQIRIHDVKKVSGNSVALGEAIPGMKLDLLGGDTPNEGEIVLSGPQLANGYWRDEQQTQKSFRFTADKMGNQRVYHTGDWALRRDGELFFAERIDNQIKIKGHRLDLAEVDSALCKCGALAAASIFHHGSIFSFVQLAHNATSDVADLREALYEFLEPHAIPSTIHLLEDLPKNDNDKVDRRALLHIVKQHKITTH